MKRTNIIVVMALCLILSLAGCDWGKTLLDEFTITLATNPAAGGTVTGGGKFKEGTEITVSAAANEGYDFENWTEDGEEVSREASYIFTVTKDRNLLANFTVTEETDEFTITLAASPAEGGSVSGGGKFQEGTEITVSAVANEGYDFENWTENGEEVSREASYIFTVTKARNLVANFTVTEEPDEFTITLAANPAAGGSVSGGGKFQEGTEITVSAVANEGYVFENWTEDGEEVSREASYIFTVTKARNLVANFTVHDYSKLRTFLEISQDGVKNGKQLNPDYDPDDSGTWSGVTWTGEETPRVQEIDWGSFNMYGSLDLNGCVALEKLHCQENRLTALDVSGCTALTVLWCWQNELTELDAGDCTALEQLNCSTNMLATLNVNGCSDLEELKCNNNRLTTLNISDCTALERLDCYFNELTSLDVRSCSALKTLWCYSNRLTILHISDCSALGELNCVNNQLTELDLSGCTTLGHLKCYNNRLAALDVSSCPALGFLACESNRLETLNISGCTALYKLFCSNNELTTLDISDFTALEEFNCSNNELTSLDVSGCTALGELNCPNNELTSLDVSGCTNLWHLDCSDNGLTSFDVSGNTALWYLDCSDNELTFLDVSGCTSLCTLDCPGNRLTFASLPLPDGISNYDYEPQKPLPIGSGGKISINENIDLSQEAVIDGVDTIFTWYDQDEEERTPTHGQGGVFSFDESFLGESIYCLMTNTKFPDLVLETFEVEVVSE